MSSTFAETGPGGAVSGTRTVERQSEGLIIEYDLEWTGDEAITVELSEQVPTESADKYGFHEDHEPPEWSVEEGELALETDLEPGGERTFVLGLVAACGEDLAYDAGEPTLEVAGGDSPGEAAEEGAETEKEGGFFDRTRPSLHGADELERDGSDGSADDDGQPSPTAELSDDEGPEADRPIDRQEATTTDNKGAVAEHATNADRRPRIDADGGVVNSQSRGDGSVASALIDELEAGTVPEPELATLREYLGDRPGVEEARLEYVQKRLGDFDAYVDALEDLLAVHGSGDDAISELDERLDGLADDLESVRRRQDEMADRIDDLADALAAQAASLEEFQVSHEADLSALEAEIESLESIRRALIDGLQRPDDRDAGTTVEDADPEALAGIEEIPIVDPGEAGQTGTPVGTDATAGDGGDATEEPPAVDESIQESLRTAEASHFTASGAAVRETDDEEFVTPVSDDVAERSHGIREGLDATEESSERAGTHGSPDAGRDDGESDGTGFAEDDIDELTADEPGDGDEADVDGADGDEVDVDEADIHDADIDVAGQTGEDSEATDGGAEADGDTSVEDVTDREDGDTGERASSIFEIGDVDADAAADEEMPTIDFEDP